tara:strand:- start:172 stop:825 length:654 start_codon:yes stop_codon:yes gene_type:complete
MKLKIQIPTQLSEINLDQYQKYLKAIDETESEYKLGSKMIEIFCNIPEADIYEFKVSDITSVSNTLQKLFNEKTDKLVKHFKINNIEYGFIPNLDEMTFGEYVDLDNNLKDWQEMHKAMNVLFRPVVQKYSDRYLIEKYKPENNNLLKQIPMDVCFSTIVFFYNLGNELSKTMLDYLKPQEIQQLQQLETLQPNGVGINQFLHSLKEMLDTSKILLN